MDSFGVCLAKRKLEDAQDAGQNVAYSIPRETSGRWPFAVGGDKTVPYLLSAGKRDASYTSFPMISCIDPSDHFTSRVLLSLGDTHAKRTTRKL